MKNRGYEKKHPTINDKQVYVYFGLKWQEKKASVQGLQGLQGTSTCFPYKEKEYKVPINPINPIKFEDLQNILLDKTEPLEVSRAVELGFSFKGYGFYEFSFLENYTLHVLSIIRITHFYCFVFSHCSLPEIFDYKLF